MHFEGQSFTENELFMIIKLDVETSAVLTFLNTIFFLKRVSLQILMTGRAGCILF